MGDTATAIPTTSHCTIATSTAARHSPTAPRTRASDLRRVDPAQVGERAVERRERAVDRPVAVHRPRERGKQPPIDRDAHRVPQRRDPRPRADDGQQHAGKRRRRPARREPPARAGRDQRCRERPCARIERAACGGNPERSGRIAHHPCPAPRRRSIHCCSTATLSSDHTARGRTARTAASASRASVNPRRAATHAAAHSTLRP